MIAQSYTTAQILFTSARTVATDSVRRHDECHWGVALFFFTPLLDAALAEGLVVLCVGLGWMLVLVLVVEGRSPVPPLPPIVRGTGVAGLVSFSVF